jgi:hypothetical protein
MIGQQKSVQHTRKRYPQKQQNVLIILSGAYACTSVKGRYLILTVFSTLVSEAANLEKLRGKRLWKEVLQIEEDTKGVEIVVGRLDQALRTFEVSIVW